MHGPLLFITNLGQPVTIIAASVFVLILAARQGQTRLAAASGVVLATIVASSILKLLLRRDRPVTEYVDGMMFSSYSFPSGHAAAATVGFGFFAYLALSYLSGPWSYILAVALVIFGALICMSRIYLGAHFPSDVLGGILLGCMGLGVIYLLVRPV